MNAERFCRLCLKTKALCEIYNNAENYCLPEMASVCLDIKMQEGDGLPMMCLDCINTLNKFYKFKLESRVVHQQLMSKLHVDGKIIPKQEPTNDGMESSTMKQDYGEINNYDEECNDFSGLELSSLPDSVKSYAKVLKIPEKKRLKPGIKKKSKNKSVAKNAKVQCKKIKKSLSIEIENSVTGEEPETHCDVFSERLELISLPDSVQNYVEINEKCDRKKRPKIMKKSKVNLSKSIDKNTNVQCDICGKTYKHKTVLKNHILSHMGIKLYSCHLCYKKFTRAEHVVVYMRAHYGIRPFVCEFCGRSFTKRQDLMRHTRIHSDEKNYSCPHCSRRFKRSGDVRSHLRSHTGDRPYSCDICHKTYSSHSGLKKHRQTSSCLPT